MTVEKNEAQLLADNIDDFANEAELEYCVSDVRKAAAMLRNLQAENERLQQALRGAQLGSQANFVSMQQQAAFKTNLLTALETIMDADHEAEFAAQAMKGVAREAVRAYREATK